MTTGLAPRSRLSARLALLLAAGLLVLGAHQAGILHWLGDPALLKAALVGQGAWGWLIFVATYALLQPFGVKIIACDRLPMTCQRPVQT